MIPSKKVTYIPTGNQMLSLPKVVRESAAIEDITFLHMGSKGLIDIRGDDEKPLLSPCVKLFGKDLSFRDAEFSRVANWIPQFSLQNETVNITLQILTPVFERGFIVNFNLTNKKKTAIEVEAGIEGRWAQSFHCVNEDKEIEGTKHVFKSKWSDNAVFEEHVGTPLFAFAPLCEKPFKIEFYETDSKIDYSLMRKFNLKSEETREFQIFVGLGFEEVAAVTSAKEMMRQGYKAELEKTLKFLSKRAKTFDDSKITELYNNNLFFCLFYSCGITLDTEELVMVTSRSPRYYVSAAYWDRDSLLWSFPAILSCDKHLAREILTYVFTRQARNFGVHSRYIDGTVLEPGFELDELMAPIIALENYVEKTSDRKFLQEPVVRSAVIKILQKLKAHKSDKTSLYETFLQPTDDMHKYKYITYDNVLVYKAFLAVSDFYDEFSFLKESAREVKAAILEHCVKLHDSKPFFAWSIDLCGNFDIYDEPAGSLQLLPYLGFISADDEIYKNTVSIIRSLNYKYSFSGCKFSEIGCPHAPHPWILSAAVSLLCKRVDTTFDFLKNAEMDSGIACESVDENTGVCATGAAFATCAGFLCHSIEEASKSLTERAERKYE